MSRLHQFVFAAAVVACCLAAKDDAYGSPPPAATLPPIDVDADLPISCASLEDGFYASPVEPCSSIFYGCSGGVASEMECADLSVFDEPTQSCLDKEWVAACPGGQATTTAPITTTLAADPPFPFDCSTKPDGSYPNAMDECSRIYVDCVAYAPVYRQCVDGAVFDAASESCLLREYVAACPGGQATTTLPTTTVLSDPAFDCASEADGFYPNPAAPCSPIFYACSGGFTRQMLCADDTVYDALSALCLLREWVTACPGGVATTTAEPVEIASDAPPFSFSCAAKADGDYAHPTEQCSPLYVSCVGEAPIYRRCIGDLKFDAVANECMEDEWVEACPGGKATIRPPVTKRPRASHNRKKVTTTIAAPTTAAYGELLDESTTKKAKKYGKKLRTTTTMAPVSDETTLTYGTKATTTTTTLPTTTIKLADETTTVKKAKAYGKKKQTTTVIAPIEDEPAYGATSTTTMKADTTKAPATTTRRPKTTQSYAAADVIIPTTTTTTTEQPTTTTTRASRYGGKRTTTTAATSTTTLADEPIEEEEVDEQPY